MDHDLRLVEHFWSWHNALLRRDGIERRMRRGELDRDLFDRSLSAAEAVLQARAGLYRHLMAAGWTPPPAVVQDLAYDEDLLATPVGALPS